ncbi:autotransporter domain-containing protein [Halanaerobium sp. ST460_2HS_T2]|uniref:autotransporter domain-containing protein n=1 Tax=Halanaerobium sp. ST460_2HS_T2 TaxID=2183914 RepID=UPI000DF450D2|nr:autotransporter domain-containing protein [Halanaerobium sp. ST460_2HS_T2]RCW60956.1 outer membrane protein with beta-barrel domain [Halanaerobium sp. ST460_2HS_T2]
MKNKIIVLMMALLMVGLVAGNAAASEWEAIGGMAITEVTLDKWNTTIDDLNGGYFDEKGKILAKLPPGSSIDQIEKMDNIDRVPIVYLGAQKALTEQWDGTIRYEYIFGGVEGSSEINGIKHTGETDVRLHGLAFLADYNLNDRWSLGGGLGFYRGTKNKKLVGPYFGKLEQDNDYDLDAVSYRLGVAYERSFAENWNLNAALGYIYMEIDDQDEGNVYSKGFSYSLGVGYNF